MRLPGPIRLLRPKQWTKNFLVFAALIFTGQFSTGGPVIASLLAFVALCLASSSVYCLNDLLDAEKDRNHPKKKERPIASGEVSPALAVVLAILCCISGLAIGYLVRMELAAGILLYLVVQLGYNFLLKRKPVIDVFVLGFGFVLRAGLGAVALDVTISAWLLFCTGALSLLLGFAKRRSEYMMEGHDVSKTRPSLMGYNQATLDALVLFSASIASLSYGMYAIQSETAQKHPGLVLTTPLVIYAVARYLYLSLSQNEGGEPETLLVSDCHLAIVVILYLLVAIAAMLGLQIPNISGAA
jgi:4-hydroxybenzoate polyprenyltransferase